MIVFYSKERNIAGSNVDIISRNLKKDSRYSAYTKVWIIDNVRDGREIAKDKKTIVVKKYSGKYYKYYKQAKYWISDFFLDEWMVPVEEQKVICTWQQQPLEKDGFPDMLYGRNMEEIVKKGKEYFQNITYFIGVSEEHVKQVKEYFRFSDNDRESSKFLPMGRISHDYFFQCTEDGKEQIKDQLDIPVDTKIILISMALEENLGIDIEKLAKDLGKEFTLLVDNNVNVEEYDLNENCAKVLRVYRRRNVNYLYAISDMLITNLSEKICEYAVIKKPIICFESKEDYLEKRKNIWISEEELPVEMVTETEKLAQKVKNLVESYNVEKAEEFNKKYNTLSDGTISERILDECFDHKFSEKYTALLREDAKKLIENRRKKYENFCKTEDIDEKKIVFESFAGDKYACNPKAIYEELLKDDRYSDFEFVWIVNKPEDFQFLMKNPNTTVVKKFSNAHYKTYASAKYWVNNMSVPEYLTPREGQVYIETWHGVPLKRMGFDIETDVDPRQSRSEMQRKYEEKAKKMNYMLSSSPFYQEKLTSAFAIDKFGSTDIFVNTGYPRNDFLCNYTEDMKEEILEKLQLPKDKKFILYAPTWRDTQYENGKIVYQVALDFKKFMDKLPKDYVLLFRAHHHVKAVNNDNEVMDNVINVADVDDINDLYVVSDMLITDYSSTMFDYALLKRPMVFYMYDLEDYGDNVRGFYFDIHEIPGPIVQKEEELADAVLKTIQNFTYDEKYKKFNEKFNTYNDGQSSKHVIDTCFTNQVSENYLELKEKRIKKINEEREALNRKKIRKYNLKAISYMLHLKSDRNSRMLMEYKNKYKGERCFLIGNGPSLTPDQLDLLKDEKCFACNMIYKVFDQTQWRPSFYCCIDSLYAKSIGSELLRMGRETPVITVATSYTKVKNKPKKMMYVNNVFSEDNYKVRGNLLAYCKTKATVMTIMAEAAFYMGFKEVYLIGVDNSDTHGTGGHFYSDSSQKLVAQQDINRIKKRLKKNNITREDIAKHTQERCNSVYEELKKYADSHGIKMYNATRGGSLEVYPRVKLEDVVKKP
ncbi:MAG: CDP-glycerol glycerophosphotransferase family protein [Lachnospiraceae bacterium]|nr:CDP-glycerol glycerophosphotransferase family protein [Lachnospiraceae bacterium]